MEFGVVYSSEASQGVQYPGLVEISKNPSFRGFISFLLCKHAFACMCLIQGALSTHHLHEISVFECAWHKPGRSDTTLLYNTLQGRISQWSWCMFCLAQSLFWDAHFQFLTQECTINAKKYLVRGCDISLCKIQQQELGSALGHLVRKDVPMMLISGSFWSLAYVIMHAPSFLFGNPLSVQTYNLYRPWGLIVPCTNTALGARHASEAFCWWECLSGSIIWDVLAFQMHIPSA